MHSLYVIRAPRGRAFLSFPVVGPKEDRFEDEGDVDVSAFFVP